MGKFAKKRFYFTPQRQKLEEYQVEVYFFPRSPSPHHIRTFWVETWLNLEICKKAGFIQGGAKEAPQLRISRHFFQTVQNMPTTIWMVL